MYAQQQQWVKLESCVCEVPIFFSLICFAALSSRAVTSASSSKLDYFSCKERMYLPLASQPLVFAWSRALASRPSVFHLLPNTPITKKKQLEKKNPRGRGSFSSHMLACSSRAAAAGLTY